MTDEDIRRWQTTLEVGPNASVQDIKNSYLRLRKLYGGGSIVLEPLEDEFPEKRRMKILVDLEEAYTRLLEMHRNRGSLRRAAGQAAAMAAGDGGPGQEAAVSEAPFGTEEMVYSGPALRRTREQLGVDLVEISKQLKLRTELLKAMEEERFELLPEEIYLKTQLKNIAACLHLKPAKVVDDYLGRFREWKRTR
ncbi:MAG: helix-turn-helix transcriptional regulator [Candidatus Aminicenantales bacterium]|jgi:hypothetical protein